jgi:predicted RNase H-like HicB family nuclease
MKDYHINIFYSEEDEGYIADIPDLIHCSAFGDTPEEALAQALVAKTAWLDAAKAENKPIPGPKYRPAIYQLSVSAGIGQVAEEKAKYK